MADNTLDVGTSRTGYVVVEGQPRTDIRATLTNTGTDFVLSFALRPHDREDIVERWFAFDQPRQIDVPRVIGFVDDVGSAVLIGCRATNIRSNLGLDVARGLIVPNYVVMGPFHIGYETVHGLQTEWTHFADWAGSHAVDWDREITDSGRGELVFRLRSRGRRL